MRSVTLSLLRSAANAFDFGGPVLCDAHHYGEGHINDTFVVWREDHSKRFILQRINTDTFTNPVGLMENVCGVTRHLRAKILAPLGLLLVGACLPQTLPDKSKGALSAPMLFLSLLLFQFKLTLLFCFALFTAKCFSHQLVFFSLHLQRLL